jgi:16S rRNA (guanine527-N7)-methyltransferase
VLAVAHPSTTWTLVDSSARRAAFLADAVVALDLAGRAVVARGRAEELGRDEELRGTFDLVTARSFGPPPVTAECASPFLRLGGMLVVSEPPTPADHRWSRDGLALVGLVDEGVVRRDGASFRRLRQAAPCPPRYPRRVGVPAKRPMFPVEHSTGP